LVDYIVVGGGSAGCAVAGRLSENAATTVALFEAGPPDTNVFIHLPATYYKTAKGPLLTRYALEPLKHQKKPSMTMVQARVLGGGSSVNGMIYIRGCPEDYDLWSSDGCPGWSYRDVLPYFKRAEDNDEFSNEVHGTGGPLSVSRQRYTHPLTKSWLQACQEAGIPSNADFNSGTQAGCGLYQVTIKRGRRCSAAVAYLNPAVRRSNLVVRTGHQVTRIVVEKGRAIGVEYLKDGRKALLRADREIVVCSGAIGSPHLLLLSGIGPADQLRSKGVPVVRDLKGVGFNLQDHVDIYLIHQLTGPYSYDKYKKLRWQVWAGLQYATLRRGPVTSNICEGGAFWWGNRADPLPDLQLHFLPGAGIEEGVESVPGGNGSTLNICQTRPKSRGFVALRSNDPSQPPLVSPNYLSETYDLDRLVEATKLGQHIMSQPAMRPFIQTEILPGRTLRSNSDYRMFVYETAQGALHPTGTCKMGTDEWAVVDPSLRVRGIDGLRVADTSIMPHLISGNTNAPAIMVGERAADFLKGNRI
jgi:choline dehydrogenase